MLLSLEDARWEDARYKEERKEGMGSLPKLFSHMSWFSQHSGLGKGP